MNPSALEDLWTVVRLAAEGSDWKRDQGETLSAWAQRKLKASPAYVYGSPAGEWTEITLRLDQFEALLDPLSSKHDEVRRRLREKHAVYKASLKDSGGRPK